jgi:hypothetical protein
MNTEDIARRAYGIWETAGQPQGKALDHWLQAESELADMPQNPAGGVRRLVPAPRRAPRKTAASPARRSKR